MRATLPSNSTQDLSLTPSLCALKARTREVQFRSFAILTAGREAQAAPPIGRFGGLSTCLLSVYPASLAGMLISSFFQLKYAPKPRACQ
jgi:hypothetical protein